jgi:hypothetical protein
MELSNNPRWPRITCVDDVVAVAHENTSSRSSLKSAIRKYLDGILDGLK